MSVCLSSNFDCWPTFDVFIHSECYVCLRMRTRIYKIELDVCAALSLDIYIMCRSKCIVFIYLPYNIFHTTNAQIDHGITHRINNANCIIRDEIKIHTRYGHYLTMVYSNRVSFSIPLLSFSLSNSFIHGFWK